MLDKLFSSFGRWMGSPDATGGGVTTETERRVWVRYPCTSQVSLQTADAPASENLSAEVVDVSRGGIGLLVDREFVPGKFLAVELPAPAGERVSRVLAYIMHVTPKGRGRWAIGCTFSSELDHDDLQTFGARRERSGADDQRSWVRFPCPVRATYQLVREAEAVPQAAQVADISANGLGLLTERALDVGTLLSVELHGAGDRPGLTILASVIRTTSQAGDDEWLLGCSFIRELTDAELQLLL